MNLKQRMTIIANSQRTTLTMRRTLSFSRVEKIKLNVMELTTTTSSYDKKKTRIEI